VHSTNAVSDGRTLCQVFHEAWLPELKLAPNGYPAFTMFENPLYVCILLEGVKAVLAAEKQLVHVPVPARVYGDIHGQYLDLMQFFHIYGIPDTHLVSIVLFPCLSVPCACRRSSAAPLVFPCLSCTCVSAF
jgi:hypothetical protein